MKQLALLPLTALLLAACSNSPGPAGGARPTITRFTVSPTTRGAPGPVTLTWETRGASSVEIDGGVGNVTPLDAGQREVTLKATTTYTLTARNAAGSATAQATASVNATPFSYRIDPGVKPFEGTVTGWDGPRPVAAVRDAAGLTSSFVANEVIVLPGSQAELDAFVARTGARVLDSYAQGTERTALLRVDPSGVNLDGFTADANALGAPGENVFSSEQGARLLALVARETVGGLKVSANFLDQPQGVLLKTQEGGAVSGTTDAFTRPEYSSTVSKPQVVQAWQFVAAHGLTGVSRRVRVGIIDGGFWLNPDGTSMKDANGQGDFPALPIQANFVGEGNASGLNPASCGQGNACAYHGNGSASVAVGTLNNGAFAAGTGGQVADPLLQRSDLSVYSVKHAVDWANGQHADVINMSFGGSCNWFCRRGKDWAGYYDAFDRAHDAGIFLVASAGNGGDDQLGDDVDDENYEPCVISGVFCVGALGGGSQVYTNGAKAYSNYGGPVNLWAPTDIVAMPDGGSAGNFVIHNGTSAAAPYVAGVAAMMKAMNPALNYDQMRDILQGTAWTDSPDPRVTRYLNAFEAVRKAADFQLPPDRFEPNNVPVKATLLRAGRFEDLNLDSVPGDIDFYDFQTGGPTLATLDLTVPNGFGKFSLAGLGLSKEKGCGDASLVSTSADKKQVVYRLPSGTFNFALAGSGPMPYDLNLGLQTAAIARDRYEGISGNDTPAQASYVGPSADGGYLDATLHSATDVDYYKFYSRGNTTNLAFSLVSKAKVLGADGPLTLRAYDSAGTLLRTVTSSDDCGTLADLALPAGFITVQVSGAAPGAYAMWFGSYTEQNPVSSVKQLIYLIMHPEVPVELGLREPTQAFVLNKVSDYAMSGLNLHGAGLHLTLYSAVGEKLAEGQAHDFRDGPGEVLNLQRTLPDQQTIVQIDRVAETPGDLPGELAVVRATLELLAGP
ncbi:S8/S53 family peptidase [Deinococcus apachensis]|uniref:S8/S53 family peptidase n=1 Tax=Deinococcus apachensis TaxID=309886 RepID=UPI000361E25C|nr:S8/S53 family peptidase [Deinococcus apachensis]